MTLAILQASGKVLIEKIKLNSSMRSCDYAFFNVLRILVKMLFIPIAFLSSKNFPHKKISEILPLHSSIIVVLSNK